jgi:hypothetical protein
MIYAVKARPDVNIITTPQGNSFIPPSFLSMYPDFQVFNILSQHLGLFFMPKITRLHKKTGVIIYSFEYLMDGSIPTLSFRSVPFSWHGYVNVYILSLPKKSI